MAQKQRLDKYLARNEFFSTRSQAKRAIMAGKVYVNGELTDKAGTPVKESDQIEVKGSENPYVSRGGLKLAKALEVFDVDVTGREIIDVGASTGGFTDCLLQQGARKVYAVDVGYGQLAWKLRQDERVQVIEKTNFRYLTPDDLSVCVPLIVIDVSFISLRLIIPPAVKFLEDNGEIIALIKPQFEAGPERIGKNGIVKDPEVHQDIIKELSVFFRGKDLLLNDLNYSPITGASSKNIEFLIYMQKTESGADSDLDNWYKKVARVVKQAHRELGRG